MRKPASKKQPTVATKIKSKSNAIIIESIRDSHFKLLQQDISDTLAMPTRTGIKNATERVAVANSRVVMLAIRDLVRYHNE